MKIFLIGYLNKNLGDDLFLDILLNKYKNVEFITFSDNEYNNYPNLKIIKINFLFKIINKIIKIISFKKCDLYTFFGNKCNAVVTLGGSMFIESNYSYRINYYNNFKVPYFIIGANIGPYKNDEYLEFLEKNIFKNARDVSLRDINSYKLFSKLDNVRVNPDLVFSLNKDLYNLKNCYTKKIIISVIDIEKKLSQVQYESNVDYYKLICEIIKYYKYLNYKIVLMSFCDNEGDNDAINKIIDMSDSKIEKYNYSGNINDAIFELSSADIIVGTRFHANILGMILQKTIIPIVYNNKTRNLLNDLNFKGVYFDLNDKEKMNVDNLKKIDYKYLVNINDISSKACEHFKILDGFIKENKNENK